MKKLALALAISPLLLTACATTQSELANYQSMSCIELAKQIGGYEMQRRNSKIDSNVNSAFGILANDDNSMIDSVFDDIDVSTAEQHLASLNQIAQQKGCKLN